MSAARRRQVPAPPPHPSIDAERVHQADAEMRKRGRNAIATIITVEAKMDDLTGRELAFTVSALEWFAGMPTPGERS